MDINYSNNAFGCGICDDQRDTFNLCGCGEGERVIQSDGPLKDSNNA